MKKMLTFIKNWVKPSIVKIEAAIVLGPLTVTQVTLGDKVEFFWSDRRMTMAFAYGPTDSLSTCMAHYAYTIKSLRLNPTVDLTDESLDNVIQVDFSKKRSL